MPWFVGMGIFSACVSGDRVCVYVRACACVCVSVQGPASDCDDYFYWPFLLFSFGPRGCRCQRILLFMFMLSNLKHTLLSESNPAFSRCLRTCKSSHLIEENVLLLILSSSVLKSNARLSFLPDSMFPLPPVKAQWFRIFFNSFFFFLLISQMMKMFIWAGFFFFKLLFVCDIPAAQQNTTFEKFNYNKGMYLISRLHQVPVI